MRTVAKCLALVALAEVAAAFAPSANLALRKTSPGAVAACPARPFQAAPRRARTAQLRAAGVQMSVTNIPITITGTNIELTDALKDYVNDKLGNSLSKVGRKVTRCDVTLNVDKNPSIQKNQEIEVVLSVKGTILRTKETTHDMYASIDAAADSVKRKLRKYKEKIIDAHRAGRPEAADFDAGEIEAFSDAIAEYDKTMDIPDPDMKLVKKKQFAMQPITTEEAVLCLEYLDHDFYVYNNKETKKISVVYKRTSGGVGLIEPE